MPVLRGLPPVTWPTIPGSESDGTGVRAEVNSVPAPTILASAEPGWVCTYQTRSDWCIPSTDNNNTCCTPARSCSCSVAVAFADVAIAVVSNAPTPIVPTIRVASRDIRFLLIRWDRASLDVSLEFADVRHPATRWTDAEQFVINGQNLLRWSRSTRRCHRLDRATSSVEARRPCRARPGGCATLGIRASVAERRP